MALIARTMDIANAVELEPVLAKLGETLHWHEVPRHVTPAATPR